MASPRSTGRRAALCYVVNIVAGASALALGGLAGSAVLVVASLAYIAVTVLFYRLFRPVSPAGSAAAAACSLIGCAISLLAAFGLAAPPVNPLGFFGLYCLGIGYLIVRSRFVPGALGIGMILGGLAWLTFFLPSLAARLTPYSMAPGILAEVSLTVWLLAVGIDDRGWASQGAGQVT